MNLKEIIQRSGKLVADNSPTILTVMAVTGTLTTAYLTGKASFRAAEIIREQEDNGDVDDDGWPTLKHRIEMVWQLYIPAVITAGLTVSCVVCANRIGNRRAAALAAVYTITERAFDEYRDKVVERVGEKKEQGFRDEIAQKRISDTPVPTSQVIMTGSGSVLCYETFTGRYFLCDMETLRKAENEINYRVIHDSYASLSDLYDLIGLDHTSNSDEVGWNVDKLLELQFSATISPATNQPCITMDFRVSPVRHYHRLS